jgi:hypothetical protein
MHTMIHGADRKHLMESAPLLGGVVGMLVFATGMLVIMVTGLVFL